MKTHNFTIETGFDDPGQAKIVMDGKELLGVNALVLKSGANSYTNISLAFDAKVSVETVAHLTSTINDKHGVFYGLYDDAMLEFNPLDLDADDKAAFIGRLLELAIERLS